MVALGVSDAAPTWIPTKLTPAYSDGVSNAVDVGRTEDLVACAGIGGDSPVVTCAGFEAALMSLVAFGNVVVRVRDLSEVEP